MTSALSEKIIKTLASAPLVLCLCLPVVAEELDEAATSDPFLSALAQALDRQGIDVIHNLNHRRLARGGIDRPRLGRFPDIPFRLLADSEEIEIWEQAHGDGEIGGLALIPENSAGTSVSAPQFMPQWLDADDEARLFVTYAADDQASIDIVRAAAQASGYLPLSLPPANGTDLAGHFYATAAHRLALDSAGARRLRVGVTEMEYLGERVRRNRNSLFREDGDRGDRSLSRGEPAVFEKESLGDEFSESTIREIIVPGGVALGETAYVSEAIIEARFNGSELLLLNEAGQELGLPPVQPATLKALFDFVQRSQATRSDSIVDIDGSGRVSISSALRDTDAGYEIMHADTLPFTYVDYLPVTKSVMIDVAVDWYSHPDMSDEMVYSSNYEIRFLSANNMRLAQTQVALEYEYGALTDDVKFIRTWGEDQGRLRENLDRAGLGGSMSEVAAYAGWIGLFRKLHEDQVKFVRGRYDFMKIDKSGRKTPSRY